MPGFFRRIYARRGLAAMTVTIALASGVAPAWSPSALASGVAATNPGRDGNAIVLASDVSFDGDQRAYDLATDRAGTSYIAWIATNDVSSTLRHVHLCTLPPGATGCRGGVQDIDPPGDDDLTGLRLLVTPSGAVTILWLADLGATTDIYDTTLLANGRLAKPQVFAGAPSNGYLLDAELGPGGTVWTVAAGYTGPLQVTAGPTARPVSVRTPYDVGDARLAFSGATPIIVITEAGRITQPVADSYRSGSTWTGFKNVKGTWADGTDIGLTATSSGVRLLTGVGNADYTTVVARWTGTGFAGPTLIGGNIATTSHDGFTDASGRLVDVGESGGSAITVSNLADTIHASAFSFPVGSANTVAGGSPQATTTPRGHGWVAWSFESEAITTGDRLEVAPFVLAGLHATGTTHGRHGTVTVTGPASCLPAVSIPVGVAGHPGPGWSIRSRRLSLGTETVGATLDGAALAPDRVYTLTGAVTFTSGKSQQTVRAAVTFRSCPSP